MCSSIGRTPTCWRALWTSGPASFVPRFSLFMKQWNLLKRGTAGRSVQICQKVCWCCSTLHGWSAKCGWNWQLLFIAPASSGLAVKVGTKRFYRSHSPLGLGGRSDRGSRTLCLNMTHAVVIATATWDGLFSRKSRLSHSSLCAFATFSCLEVAIP